MTNFRMNLKTQRGYTLVEVLVAVVLGLILTAAVVQSYTATKQTYQVTDGVSRIQENARFALHFLSRDLREAGYASCIGRVRNKLHGDPSEFISFDSPVTGWNYTGTESGNSAFTLSGTVPTTPSNASNWSGTGGNLPSFLLGEVVAGSDVLWFKNFEELDIIVKEHNDKAAPITTEDDHGVEDDSIMMVGNCSEVEMFQHLSQGSGNQVSLTASTGNSGSPGNRPTTGGVADWSREYTAEDNIYGFVQTYYYVGIGAGGLPSLFRFKTTLPAQLITSAKVASESEELVEGVETMQILFGEDLNDDGSPNKYVSANEVIDFDQVASTRIGLLLRSPNNAADQDQQNEYTLLDSILFTHAQDDSILRYAVNSTVKPRNRGLDENLNYYVCDNVDEANNEPDNGIDTCT